MSQGAVSTLTSSALENPEERNQLKQTIINLINTELDKNLSITEKGLFRFIQYQLSDNISEYIKKIVSQIHQQEIEFMGSELSDRHNLEDMLDIHATCYLAFWLVQLKRTGFEWLTHAPTNVDLTDTEILQFYCNMIEILFSPYLSYRITRGIKQVSKWILPFLIKYAKFLPVWAMQNEKKNTTALALSILSSNFSTSNISLQTVSFTGWTMDGNDSLPQIPFRVEKAFDFLHDAPNRDNILENIWKHISREEKEALQQDRHMISAWNQIFTHDSIALSKEVELECIWNQIEDTQDSTLQVTWNHISQEEKEGKDLYLSNSQEADSFGNKISRRLAAMHLQDHTGSARQTPSFFPRSKL